MVRRPTRKNAPYQVFLSYSRQDTWIAHVMREKIEARGVKVWLDAIDLPAGANVRERIKEGMRASAEALILLSPASRNSNWVKHELGIADGMDKWTTLLMLHVTADDVPEPVSHLNYLSINDFDAYLAQLAGRQQAAAGGAEMSKKARSLPKVLIRSAGQDLELARDIARRLRSAGLQPMADLALPPAKDFKKRLAAVMRSSDAVLFLLTPAALASPWTAYETGVAEGTDKPILLVLAGVGQRPLPPLLESYQTVPYDQLDEAVLMLNQRLRGETATADGSGRR